MAKVTGPLMSLDARGKLGGALVFIGWKGIKDVRLLVTPANPQSAGQGNIRTIIGGLGKAVGKLVATAPFVVKLVALSVIPDQQTHQSYLVKYIKDTYFAGSGATLVANYTALLKAYTGCTAYTAFEAAGTTLGIGAFGMAYDAIDDFAKGFGVYLLAKAAIALGFTGSPYTTALSAWTGAQIDKLVNHIS